MHPMTQALHTRIDTAGVGASVTPIYQSSAFEAGSPYFYTRKNNPNTQELEDVVRGMEGTAFGVAVSTGMAAIRICLEQLRPGGAMVVNKYGYGCSHKLVQRFCERFGIALSILDLTDDGVVADLPSRVDLVLLETPTNPFLRTVDVARVCEAVRFRNPGAIVVVDNTWATPLCQQPVRLGADVSLHSATKYLSGHSDVMGGLLLTDREDLAEAFRQERFYSGAVMDPHAAWLLRRSLQTLEVRLARQGETTRRLCAVLRRLPQVDDVYYPTIDARQLRSYAGIVFFSLRADLVDRYADFIAGLRCFGSGTGMGCVTSMVAQPYTGSHASLTAEEKRAMDLDRGLVRLCFGLEEPADLEADLRRALSEIDAVR